MILIVDDSSDTAVILSRLLKRAQLDAVTRGCGKDFLDYLQNRENPRLVILDVAMPGMSGIDCLRAMRDNPRWRDIPVVMYTADASLERKNEALRLGAKDYLIKGSAPWVDVLLTVTRHAVSPNRGR